MAHSTVIETAESVTPATGTRRRLPVVALITATAISSVGNQITALAVPWFVLQTTGSAARTGITAAAVLLPSALAAFFGGPLVDRLGFRRMSVFSDLLSCITVAAVPLLYHTVGLSFPLLLLLMFCGALFDAPGSTARQSMVPELAESAGSSLERVNSAWGTIFACTNLFGPPLAGVLIAWLGASNVLWLDAASFAISALLVAILVPGIASAAAQGTTYLADIREGLAFLWRDGLLLTISLLALSINFVSNAIYSVVMPVYAKEIFGSPKALGIMMSGFGLGALAGSALYGWLGPRLAGRRMVLLTVALISVPIALLALLPPLWTVFALNAVVGLGSGMVNPFIVTVFHRRTPLALRGRAFGTFIAFALFASPLGVLIGGALIEAIGLRWLIAAAGAILCLIAIIAPFLRVLAELNALPEEPDPGE